MDIKHASLVEVRIELKNSQHRGFNDWEYTLDGKERRSTHPIVIFYAVTFEDAIHKFELNEILKITMTYTSPEYGRV